MARSYTVSEVARASGVTVRTLHHYDEIGLLVPSRRRRNGYRQYAAADLQRLQRIVVLRELGFSLEVVRALIDGDAGVLRDALTEQRQRVSGELRRLEAVRSAIDRTLAESSEKESEMEKLFAESRQFDHLEYEDEARSHWGHTESYRESQRRTRSYRQDDWVRIKAEAAELLAAFGTALGEGLAADGEPVRALAERHRLHIDRWFYPCSHTQHIALAELYLSDPRYGAYFERETTGLTAYVASAIHANASQPAPP